MNGDFVWTGNLDRSYSFGAEGDLPVVGDWDNSGKVRIGVFRNGTWILDWDGDGQWNPDRDRTFQFGGRGDIPVVGNWGDGKTGIGVFRADVFMLDMNHNLKWDSADKTIAIQSEDRYPFSGAETHLHAR